MAQYLAQLCHASKWLTLDGNNLRLEQKGFLHLLVPTQIFIGICLLQYLFLTKFLSKTVFWYAVLWLALYEKSVSLSRCLHFNWIKENSTIEVITNKISAFVSFFNAAVLRKWDICTYTLLSWTRLTYRMKLRLEQIAKS